MNRTIGKFVSLAALALFATMVLAASGSAAGGPKQFTVIDQHVPGHDIPVGGAGDKAGNLDVFSSIEFDAKDKHKVGTDDGFCFRTSPEKGVSVCVLTFTFAKGTITTAGNLLDEGVSKLAVTGGTGAYSGSRGSISIALLPNEKFKITFTLK
jgi:allene oxide cyclase-like protein